MDQGAFQDIIGSFAAKHLECSESDVAIQPLSHLESPKKWTYSILDQSGNPLSFVQAALVEDPETWRHQHYLMAINMFQTLNLKYSHSPQLTAFERISSESGVFDLAMIKSCPGKTVQEWLGTNEQALERYGQALAELHLSKFNVQGPIGGTYLEIDSMWIERFMKLLKTNPEWLSESPEQITQQFHEIASKINPRTGKVGILHGDPVPTNIIYDPMSDRITFIDIDWMAQSFDASGQPIGPIAQDYCKACESLRSYGYHSGASEEMIQSWIKPFSKTYRLILKDDIPTHDEIHYYQTLYWIRELVRADRKIDFNDYRNLAVERLINLLFIKDTE